MDFKDGNPDYYKSYFVYTFESLIKIIVFFFILYSLVICIVYPQKNTVYLVFK